MDGRRECCRKFDVAGDQTRTHCYKASALTHVLPRLPLSLLLATQDNFHTTSNIEPVVTLALQNDGLGSPQVVINLFYIFSPIKFQLKMPVQ